METEQDEPSMIDEYASAVFQAWMKNHFKMTAEEIAHEMNVFNLCDDTESQYIVDRLNNLRDQV